MRIIAAVFALLLAVPGFALATGTIPSKDDVNAATFNGKLDTSGSIDPLVLRLQVLLDRVHASPGVIDGRYGKNVSKAVESYRAMLGLKEETTLDTEVWDKLATAVPGDALVDYTVTEKDAAGPYVEKIPEDYREMAKMKALGYTGPAEMLAERFHMDIDLLKALNPGADFGKTGTRLVVAATGRGVPPGNVAKLVADTSKGTLVALDGSGGIIAAYPATIGSAATPSPSGEHTVRAIAPNPAYYYNPEKNFEKDGIKEKLKLPPGPNGPVGSTWIDLSKETYGIHGTPDPAEIDKNFSNGCVRLTNWDAEELAQIVKPGVKVVFKE